MRAVRQGADISPRANHLRPQMGHPGITPEQPFDPFLKAHAAGFFQESMIA